jgi:hypothetical protein
VPYLRKSSCRIYILTHKQTNKQKSKPVKKTSQNREKAYPEQQQAKLKNTGKESLVVPNRVTDSLASQIFALLTDTAKDDEILLTSSDTLLPPSLPPVGFKAPVRRKKTPTNG